MAPQVAPKGGEPAKAPPRKRKVVRSSAVMRLHDEFRAQEAAAIEALNLAMAWINDGAYASGARCLRDAAYKFDAAQKARNDGLLLSVHGSKRDGR